MGGQSARARAITSDRSPARDASLTTTATRLRATAEERDLIERYPPIAVLGAWLHTLQGRAAGAERWVDAAERW